MTQNPRILDTKSSKTLQLKPQLAAALGCLEVQLDQELARYRRTKTAYKAPSQIGTSSQPQPFTAITTTTARSPAAVPTSLVPQEKFIEQAKIPPVSVPETPAQMPVMKTANTETQTPPPPPPPEIVVKETIQEANSSIVPANQQKIENPLSDETPKQPDDYLESSEALLRSLTEEQPQKTEKTEKTNSDLLSPLGIGSILLLLVASLTLGYVIYNPKSLSVFSFGKESQANLPGTSSITNVKNTTLKNPKPASTPIPKYPNLATDEFPEVNNPNDVVGLKPKAKPTPTAAPKPVAAVPITPIAPVQQAQELSPVTPKKPTVTTSPLPAIGQKAIADAKPSADGFYHLVIDNQGSRAFESARVVIPDAYLSPDKKLIYLGALKTKAQLKQQMQLLESKGIKARVQ